MANVATSKGIATSFGNTPQAGDDLFNFTEDNLVLFAADATHLNTVSLDVMSNDQGGAAKTLYSIDDGNGGQLSPDADLLAKDALANGTSVWEHTQQGDDMRIDHGKIDVDLTHAFSALGITNIQQMGAHDVINEDFVYAIQLGNGTVSEAHVHMTIQGVNDAATFSGSDTGSVTEDTTLTTGGTLQVQDVDHNEAVFTGATTGNGLHGTYGDFSFDTVTGNWGYSLNNGALNVQQLNSGDHVTDTLSVVSLDGTTHDVVVTVNGQDSYLGPDLLTNGSFEEGQTTSGGAWQGFSSLPGWTNVNGQSLEVVSAPYAGTADSDGHWLDTQASPGGIDIKQSVDVSTGAHAQLSVTLSTEQVSGLFTNPAEHLVFNFNGIQALDISASDIVLADGNMHTFTADIVGLAGLDTLEIQSVGATDNVGFALDHVMVQEWHL
jgi:VCBS repeat-containing protein